MYRNVVYEQRKKAIRLFTWDENGNRCVEEHRYFPYFYLETSSNPDAYSIYNTPLKKRIFNTQYERIQALKDKPIKRIFGNLNPEQQFLIDHFHQSKEFQNNFEFSKHPLKIFYLDIETYSPGGFPKPEEANDQINLITIYDSLSQTFYTWGLNANFKPNKPNIKYYYCSNEKEMLQKFLDFWMQDYCDIVTGWNTEFFDIPYIINRVQKILGENESFKISPIRQLYEKNVKASFGKFESKWFIKGISHLDYLDIYKTFCMSKRETYKLDYIGEIELGEKKVAYKGKLTELSDNDWQKYVEYNIQDVNLIVRLEEEKQYLQLIRTLAYMGLCPFENALGTITVVTGAISIEALNNNQIISTFKSGDMGNYEGGYVQEPQRGLHDYVVSFDANSLYPNTMITLNLSPETKLGKFEEDKDKVYVKLLNGKNYNLTKDKFEQFIKQSNIAISKANVLFSQNKKGIIPSIIDRVYDERVQIKKQLKDKKIELKKLRKGTNEYKSLQFEIERLDLKQYTIKILLNRMYGYFANRYSPMADVDLASSITLTGQSVIKQANVIGQEFVNKICKEDVEPVDIYNDTDSTFLSIKPILHHLNIDSLFSNDKIRPEIYKICESLETYLNKQIKKWSETELNSKDSRYIFKREKICNSGLFIEKKRYITHVFDNEGIPCDEIKYTGVNVVSTSIPESVKPFIKNIVNVLLKTKSYEETNKAYLETYEKFQSLSPEEVAFPRGITNYDKFAKQCNGFTTVKGMPIHAKAAYFYNMLLKEYNITDQYENIQNNDKMKFFYVMKNKFGISCLGYKDYLPDEFKNDFKMDTELMFEKIIFSSVESLYNAVGWSINHPNQQYQTNIFDLLS